MFLRIAKWLLGFSHEVAGLRSLVKELSWDSAFGMYTRAALLVMSRSHLKGDKAVVFLDLDRIHELNQLYGYEEVNRRVRLTFRAGVRRREAWAARWYSGDEIVLILDCGQSLARAIVARLGEVARQHGLSFTHAMGGWQDKQDLAGVVNGLSQHVLLKKAKRSQPAQRACHGGQLPGALPEHIVCERG